VLVWGAWSLSPYRTNDTVYSARAKVACGIHEEGRACGSV
jgi:hypothetical protein